MMITSYSSRTSAYYVLVDLNSPAIDYFPLPPFPEFETTNEEGEPYLPLLRQLQIPIQIQASEQTTVQVLDSNLTLRWKIWRELEAFFGVKVTRYDGAATEIRAKAASLIPELKAVLPFRHPALHSHLRGQGLARLQLKQCWRAIPLADAPLARVRMAWYSSGRSIKKLSVREGSV